MPGKRICLFGGTFDPIHSAHLRIAEAARAAYHLEDVLFVPAGNPPHKSEMDVTPYEDRFRMVAAACEPYPGFSASRLEAGTERSYTIETIERFRREMDPKDELFFLIGSDAFDEIGTWKRWREVVRMTDFIVASRPGVEYRIPDGACVHRLDGLDLPVASSSIRARLAARGSIPELPPQVYDYIQAHGLYAKERTEGTLPPS